LLLYRPLYRQWKRRQQIPRHVWTYWHIPNLPRLIADCLEGWQRHNPHYRITVVHGSTLANYISIPLPDQFETLTYQRQADWARLVLLMEHGGIWRDGFMFSLDLFTDNQSYPFVDSWFIGTRAGGAFVTAWFHEFDFAIRTWGNNGQDYLTDLISRYGAEQYARLTQKAVMLDYLTIHVAAQKIMQIDGIQPLASQPAETSVYRPYHVLIDHCQWDSELFAQRLFTAWQGPLPHLVKIRSEERHFVTKLLQNNCDIHPQSIYFQSVNGCCASNSVEQ
jgi:hypothetical protein